MAGLIKPSKSIIQQSSVFLIPIRGYSSKTLPRQSSLASDHGPRAKFSLSAPPKTSPGTRAAAPLSILPLESIIRSLAVTSISSSQVCMQVLTSTVTDDY
jgi:hypothetical protein